MRDTVPTVFAVAAPSYTEMELLGGVPVVVTLLLPPVVVPFLLPPVVTELEPVPVLVLPTMVVRVLLLNGMAELVTVGTAAVDVKELTTSVAVTGILSVDVVVLLTEEGFSP